MIWNRQTSRSEITDVFTPRKSDVNLNMYVHRPVHEKSLVRAFKRDSHTLLFGESGNGKSWLYKKVLDEQKIPYLVANCANASRVKSLTAEICNAVIEPGTVRKLGFCEEMAAELNSLLAKGGLKHAGDYEITQDEPLLRAFKIFHEAQKGKKILVLDNLESIFDNKILMDELADILILLDDARYSSCEINILIVGIPNGVLQYFRETKNTESVANRVQEIQKVDSLGKEQVKEIIDKGFRQLLITITASSLDLVTEHVWNVTLGIAQRVHEYCENLAYEVKDNSWKFEKTLLDKADLSWLLEGLRQSYQTLEGHLNSRETAVARRNQVIYCIARINSHQFDSSDLDALIRKEFPKTVPKTNMGIGSILTELATGTNPLILKTPKTNTYSIRDPRYLMCIRVALYKDSATEKIIKKNFTR